MSWNWCCSLLTTVALKQESPEWGACSTVKLLLPFISELWWWLQTDTLTYLADKIHFHLFFSKKRLHTHTDWMYYSYETTKPSILRGVWCCWNALVLVTTEDSIYSRTEALAQTEIVLLLARSSTFFYRDQEKWRFRALPHHCVWNVSFYHDQVP